METPTRNEALSDGQMRALVGRAKEARTAMYLEQSRNRLDKIVSTKIRTSFIGALAAFEEAFGFLWGKGKDEADLTPQERSMFELWIQARTRALNNGNTQLRAAQTEIANHVVSWNRYHMTLPVRPNAGEIK
jgi:hypothetical protein